MRAIALILLMAMALNAQDPAPVTIATANGTVEVERKGAWVPAGAGEGINPGEKVRTGHASSATIAVSEETVIAVQPAQDMAFRTYVAGGRRVRDRARTEVTMPGIFVYPSVVWP